MQQTFIVLFKIGRGRGRGTIKDGALVTCQEGPVVVAVLSKRKKEKHNGTTISQTHNPQTVEISPCARCHIRVTSG